MGSNVALTWHNMGGDVPTKCAGDRNAALQQAEQSHSRFQGKEELNMTVLHGLSLEGSLAA
jgi:hypothetical protein